MDNRVGVAKMQRIYKQFVRCVEEGDMLFRLLGFDYPEDKRARMIVTQLMFGRVLMIAPVFEQNINGR